MSEVTPSREQVQVAYAKLAAEVGDLYFALDNARATVTALEARMEGLKEQRSALQKAYESAPGASEAVTEAVAEGA